MSSLKTELKNLVFGTGGKKKAQWLKKCRMPKNKDNEQTKEHAVALIKKVGTDVSGYVDETHRIRRYNNNGSQPVMQKLTTECMKMDI